MQLRRQREQVASAARSLAAGGLVSGTSGNVSAREGEVIAVTPTGGVLAEMTPEDVTVITLDGTVVEGAEPTSEVALHLGVYERYGAGAVVHTHAPMATALSCVLEELPCVHYGMLALGGAVRVAPYTTFGTEELAASVLDALEGKTAAMMANHGTVTLGADLAGAVAATELLEWASSVYWHASQIGEPRILSEADQAAVIEAVVARGYGQR
ncbi:MAG: aldolase [Solirubrobacterales bacterium]|nr:aldolase [Solirubrobacterales bacterium]